MDVNRIDPTTARTFAKTNQARIVACPADIASGAANAANAVVRGAIQNNVIRIGERNDFVKTHR